MANEELQKLKSLGTELKIFKFGTTLPKSLKEILEEVGKQDSAGLLDIRFSIKVYQTLIIYKMRQAEKDLKEGSEDKEDSDENRVDYYSDYSIKTIDTLLKGLTKTQLEYQKMIQEGQIPQEQIARYMSAIMKAVKKAIPVHQIEMVMTQIAENVKSSGIDLDPTKEL